MIQVRSKIILIAMSIFLLAILASAMQYRLSPQGNLVKVMNQPQNSGMPASGGMPPQGMPPQGMSSQGMSSSPMSAMSNLLSSETVSPEIAQRAGALMQQLQTNPDNPDVLLSLSHLFYEVADWEAMKTFALRAGSVDQTSARAAYLTGIAQSELGEKENAIKSLELSLSLQENPATRYGLAILYRYSFNDKEKALTHLAEALAYPALPDSLKISIEDEIKSLNEK